MRCFTYFYNDDKLYKLLFNDNKYHEVLYIENLKNFIVSHCDNFILLQTNDEVLLYDDGKKDITFDTSTIADSIALENTTFLISSLYNISIFDLKTLNKLKSISLHEIPVSIYFNLEQNIVVNYQDETLILHHDTEEIIFRFSLDCTDYKTTYVFQNLFFIASDNSIIIYQVSNKNDKFIFDKIEDISGCNEFWFEKNKVFVRSGHQLKSYKIRSNFINPVFFTNEIIINNDIPIDNIISFENKLYIFSKDLIYLYEDQELVKTIKLKINEVLKPITEDQLSTVVCRKTLLCNLRCPITHEIMIEPVTAVDGFTYERSAIEEWFSKQLTSPMTREIISSSILYENNAIKHIIKDLITKDNT